MNKKLPLVAFATLLLAGCAQQAPALKVEVMPVKEEVMVKNETTMPKEDAGSKAMVYESVGSYISPAGPEEIGVKIMVNGGIVTDVAVTPKATVAASVKWQTAFAGGIRSEVTGKKLADLSVTKVAGSSLTGKGFNEALVKIKAQM